MMYYIGYAIFGLFAGGLARLLHPGKDPMNWFWTMILGIGGAELGGAVLGARSGPLGWAAAIGGAIVLLIAYHFFTARSQTSITGGGTSATNSDYKNAVFDDLSKGPR